MNNDVDAAPIDGTDEARAIAAAAREAAKRKHEEIVKPEQAAPQAKKTKKASTSQRTATSTHTVAVPDGFEADTKRDAAVYGTCCCADAGAQQGQQVWHGLRSTCFSMPAAKRRVTALEQQPRLSFDRSRQQGGA